MVLTSGKVRKAEVMRRSGAARPRGSRLSRSGRGAAEYRLTSSGAHLASGQDIFLFLLIPCGKRQERWKGSAHQIFAAWLHVWSWLLRTASCFTRNSSGKKKKKKNIYNVFGGGVYFSKSTLNLSMIDIKMNKWLTNNKSRKKFLKSRVYVSNELDLAD